MRKHVEASDGVGHEVSDEEARDAFERETMDGGSKPTFDRLDRAFNFADVTVGRNDIEGDGENVLADAGELGIRVYIAHVETTGAVETDGRTCLAKNGRLVRSGAGETVRKPMPREIVW